MSKRPETDPTQAQPAGQKARWESPNLRRAGDLGNILMQSGGKTVLSEADTGVEMYKPKGQN
jgi:hypothetical protein